MKVLVTGGAGFIGSTLVKEWLRRGAEVTVIDNLRTGRIENLEDVMDSITFIQKSICERDLVIDALEGIDYVFNLAAMVSVPESVENMCETVNINVNGLLNVLDGCVKHGIKKIVHSSSAAVYGKYPELPSKEIDLPKPLSPYAITKLDGEYYLNFYNSEFGLPTVSLRYFNVFGKGQRPDSAYAAAIPAITHRSLNNETIEIYGDGEQTRDFVYVMDVVNANILAAEKGQGLYNVARGESTSINQLVKIIMELTNSSSPVVYKDVRAGDVKYSTAEVSKIKELGFVPETEIYDGLKNTVEYFKDCFTK